MKVHLLAQVHGNFGDELNRWLWHGLLADVGSKADDDVQFVGIGSRRRPERAGRFRSRLAAAELLALREQVQTPLHIVEILSSVHLRERLNLKNGDAVALRISKRYIGKIHFLERFIWAAFWSGRRHWFYSHKSYSNHTVRFGKELGATQEQPVVCTMKEIVGMCRKLVSKSSPKTGLLPRRE